MGDVFQGKVALMTGAPTPFSLAVARRLGNEGARLAFVGRGVSRHAGIQALLYQFLHETLCLDTDLTDAVSVERAIEIVEDALGPIDYLVHTVDQAEEPQTLRGGLVLRGSTAPMMAALTCTRGAMQRMLPRRAGHIVHLVNETQIGAVEMERLALSGLTAGWRRRDTTIPVALSAIYFSEAATLPAQAADSSTSRILETYAGRIVEEEDWAARVILEEEIGNLVMHVCERSLSSENACPLEIEFTGGAPALVGASSLR